MTNAILAVIASVLKDYNYGYMQYKGKRPGIYWVGEYSTSSHAFESGHDGDEFIVTGTTEGAWSTFEAQKDAIIRLLDNYRYANGGLGFVMNFTRALNIPTDTAEVKRIELHFSVDSWRQ